MMKRVKTNLTKNSYFDLSCGLNVQAANIRHTLAAQSHSGTEYKMILDD